jgi:4a-hydroxytetrahydrobiopterin dehydratase
MKLSQKKCIPCEEKTMKPMKRADTQAYLIELPKWILAKNAKKISRTWLFKDFVHALKFINQVGVIAEKNGHHPDIFVSYNKVTLDLWTHSIGGLSENDFIVAAKIDKLKK